MTFEQLSSGVPEQNPQNARATFRNVTGTNPSDNATLRVNQTPYEDGQVYNADGGLENNPNSKVTEMSQDQFEKRIGFIINWHVREIGKQKGVFGSAENLYGGSDNFLALLDDIGDAVYSNPEFQRGTANYNRMYQVAWETYMDIVSGHLEALTLNGDPLARELLMKRTVPGIYHRGYLTVPPFSYIFAPRSNNGNANLRRFIGIDNPGQQSARELVASRIRGYGEAWMPIVNQEFFKQYGRFPNGQELQAGLEEMAKRMENLGPQARLDYAVGDSQYAGVPVQEQPANDLDMVVNNWDQQKVLDALRSNIDGRVTSERALDRVRFEEIQSDDVGSNRPQVVRYNIPSEKQDGKEVKEPGVGYIRIRRPVIGGVGEQQGETVVDVVDETSADRMLTALYADLSGDGVYSGYLSEKYHNEMMQSSETYAIFINENEQVAGGDRNSQFYNKHAIFELSKYYRVLSPFLEHLYKGQDDAVAARKLLDLATLETQRDDQVQAYADRIKQHPQYETMKNVINDYLKFMCKTPENWERLKNAIEASTATPS